MLPLLLGTLCEMRHLLVVLLTIILGAASQKNMKWNVKGVSVNNQPEKKPVEQKPTQNNLWGNQDKNKPEKVFKVNQANSLMRSVDSMNLPVNSLMNSPIESPMYVEAEVDALTSSITREEMLEDVAARLRKTLSYVTANLVKKKIDKVQKVSIFKITMISD